MLTAHEPGSTLSLDEKGRDTAKKNANAHEWEHHTVAG
jgi:hypothetical protein